MPDVQHKRGTRADLITLAAADGLLIGQIYVITDEDRLAVAKTIGTYQAMAKEGEPAGAVVSDPTGVTGADAVTNIMSLTQAEYDAIVTPNASTIYAITDA